MIRRILPVFAALAALLILPGCKQQPQAGTPDANGTITLRVGHFPNITHVQALVAQALSRQGKGWFEQRLGPNVKIDWYSYNAGPSAMEGLLAGTVDLTYVGPSPALNAYSRSGGKDVRIIAGAASGGSGLVVQPGSGLKVPADFRGKKIATPQIGNTQDVSCRAWLIAGGLNITQNGGDAQVLPTENPDQLSLFKLKKLDAVWTVEPWLSRLEMEAGAEKIVQEKDTITVLVTGTKFLTEHADLATKFVAAHRELTQWIEQHPQEAQALALKELGDETGNKISAGLIAHAWGDIKLTDTVSLDSIKEFVDHAKAAGFLKETPDLSQLIVTLPQQ